MLVRPATYRPAASQQAADAESYLGLGLSQQAAAGSFCSSHSFRVELTMRVCLWLRAAIAMTVDSASSTMFQRKPQKSTMTPTGGTLGWTSRTKGSAKRRPTERAGTSEEDVPSSSAGSAYATAM